MTKEQDRSVSLRKKYPFLILLFLGFSFLFTFHTMINSFWHRSLKISTVAVKKLASHWWSPLYANYREWSFLNSLSKRNPANFGCLLPVFHLLSEDSWCYWPVRSWWWKWRISYKPSVSLCLFQLRLICSINFWRMMIVYLDKRWSSSPPTLGGVIGNVLGGSLLQHFGVWEMLIFGTGFAVLGALLTILGIRKIPKLSEDSGDITK